MTHKHKGGCAHHQSYSDHSPIDNHTCHCSVCKRVTNQPASHVVFFKHADLNVSNADSLKRIPFNDQNPDGPLELCVCEDCGSPIMLDDKQKRIRVVVPNLMGYEANNLPLATYHAFYDPDTGEPKPNDGLPVYEGLRPDFVWPQGS
ncbi:MAG: GFA family protein [Parahaliea sp.]